MNKCIRSCEIIDEIHSLFRVDNIEILDQIYSKVLIQVQRYTGMSISELSQLHKFVATEDVNNLRIHLFEYINSYNFDWSNILTELGSAYVTGFVGPDFLVQKKANISIQMPYDQTSVLPIHSDCISGDSPWQANFWLPLTHTVETSSMFLVSMPGTLLQDLDGPAPTFRAQKFPSARSLSIAFSSCVNRLASSACIPPYCCR
jgi:sporadic carbohydrate cluster 2OG-Fe(II) oxygenase